MRLSEFINTHLDEILEAWASAAERRAPDRAELDMGKIRDHAARMLRSIADDLERPTDDSERVARHERTEPEAEAAAEQHGIGRAEYGFSLDQIVWEFRALRSTVLSFWRPPHSEISKTDVEDLKRFDDAIDQTLAKSVARYIQAVDTAKETFIGILGHDLKTPLSAVIMSARFLLEAGDLNETQRSMAERIERSGKRMHQMVSDLLDFTRSRLGSGIPIKRVRTDLARVVRDAVDEVAASNPQAALDVDVRGVLQGEWDPRRVSQALTNLIGNAVQHGAEKSHVGVHAESEDGKVVISVHNEGAPIPPDRIGQLFDPTTALRPNAHGGKDSSHLGLGLHIAKAIAKAHGGRIEVESTAETGTTFKMILPRAA